ncbi:hypothetical protein DPMN_109033 [Dreissena polymorpha]|uniref:Zinc-binding loop region of homing endonuclease domain-containing protein n=1 Tax=Dreissena polymorpha TaxID=45954 RepID=A0A9D4KA02_DREPO|nr:hypothetical protein DPMN_109033 [Dreissena polymorpha]
MASAFYASVPSLHTVQRLKNLVEQKSGGAGAAGACRLWVGEHDRYGYAVLRATVAGKRIHFLAHRLAFFLHFLGTMMLIDTMNVSHICHNKKCIKVEHLSYEPQSVNNSRKKCLATRECTGHHGYPKCIL